VGARDTRVVDQVADLLEQIDGYVADLLAIRTVLQ